MLRWEARLILRKYHPKVVAVTGSVGKTTTKDAVFAVLSKFYYVRKSEKSHNSEMGLLLAVLGCPNGWNDPAIWLRNIAKGLELILIKRTYPEYLVLEVGAGKPGDIARISAWLRTDIVILAAIGSVPAHIEFFGSYEKVLEEKARLTESLKKNGLLLLNNDNLDILKYIKRKDVKRVTFGVSEDTDMQASNKSIFYQTLETGGSVPVGVSFKINYSGHSLPVIMEGVFGINHVYGALAAILTAKELGLDVLGAADALRSYEAPPGRMRILRGVDETFVIDDTYNSSPKAAEAALETLAEISGAGRKIAVLGDMLELGRHTDEAHMSIGTMAGKAVDLVIAVGPRAKLIAEGALRTGMAETFVIHFNTAREAGASVRDMLQKGDMLLVKGSQSMRMERVVEALMAYPEYKEQLLVRQEDTWLAQS